MARLIGLAIEELDTPALLLDASLFEKNIQQMSAYFRDRHARLRPHFKNHKCTQVARRQLEAGSIVGITCAKLGEAETLADGGCGDILIANQIVGPTKVERLIELAKRTKTLRVAVDEIDNARAIAEAAKQAGVTIGLLIEVDIGMNRCGVAPGEPALQLARQMSDLKGVTFDGIQAYEGHLVLVADREDRRQRTLADMQKAIDTRRLLESNGIPVAIVSGGSTSTYTVTSDIEGIDEIQAGTYATMDWMYQELAPEFEIALSVLARVISRPKPRVAILDAGAKGLGHEFGPPKVKGMLDADMTLALSEEHCTVQGTPEWKTGQCVELIPSHSCTTCNLYRQIHAHEGGRIVDVWPIDASGRLT